MPFINKNDDIDKLLLAAFPELSKIYIRGLLNIKKQSEGFEKREVILNFEISIEDKIELIEKINSFIHSVDDTIDEITFISTKRVKLSRMSVLRAIKLLQPASIEEIQTYLDEKKFAYLEKELRGELDTLRKSGLVLWSKDDVEGGRYRVTEAALSIIPHGTYKGSSDISRILEIKNREW